MEKNQFFNFKRFVLVLRNDLIINYKKYLLFLLGTLVIGTALIWLQMPKNNHQYGFGENRYFSFFMIALFGLAAVVGTSFSELNSKIKTTGFLMMPGSAFEKYMAQFSIRVIFGLVLFLLIFWLDTQIARLIALSSFEGAFDPGIIKAFNYGILIKWYQNESFAFMVVSMIWGVGMCLFAVRLFFKRSPFVKVILLLSVIGYIFGGVVWLVAHIAYPEILWDQMRVPDGPGFIEGYNIFESYLAVYLHVTWITALILGYFKLKERQV